MLKLLTQSRENTESKKYRDRSDRIKVRELIMTKITSGSLRSLIQVSKSTSYDNS